MGKRLADNITSQYIAAANLLRPKKARKKIVAYVESYDDVFFWRSLLSEFEDEEYYFDSQSEMQTFFNETNHQFCSRRCRKEIKCLYKNEWLIAYE